MKQVQFIFEKKIPLATVWILKWTETCWEPAGVIQSAWMKVVGKCFRNIHIGDVLSNPLFIFPNFCFAFQRVSPQYMASTDTGTRWRLERKRTFPQV